MVMELFEDNEALLNSVTVLYFNEEVDGYREAERIALLSKYVKNIIVVNNIEDAKKESDGKDIDILVTDFDVSNDECMHFLSTIRRCNPWCSIIVYTSKTDAEHLLDAINVRVDKYIVKSTDFKDIVKAIIYMAGYAFTLKSLYSVVPIESTHLSSEAYDTISQSMDDLQAVIAKLAVQHSDESMPVIHSINGVIFRLKSLLKNSY